jgi:serine/threonine protein kinase
MSMEYCPNGDLFDLVKKTGKLSNNLARSLFLQILDGVEHLHEVGGVAHLDMKLENILVGNDFKLKLCDFGFVEELNQKVMKSKGTDGYKAPEIYMQSNDGFSGDKADIFALGVILFIMVFGVPPFTEANKENPYYRLFYRGDTSLKYFFRLHPATKSQYTAGELDGDLLSLLMTLMDENPDKRPKNVRDIKSHCFLSRNLLTEDEFNNEMKTLLAKYKSAASDT